MSITLWLGLGTVVVGAMVLVPMIFAAEPEPATVESNPEGGDAVLPQRRTAPEPLPITIRVPETVSIHPAWWERLRGLLGLVLVTVGLAAAVAVVVGLAVMVVGLTLLN
jgi:hypothetical protein